MLKIKMMYVVYSGTRIRKELENNFPVVNPLTKLFKLFSSGIAFFNPSAPLGSYAGDLVVA